MLGTITIASSASPLYPATVSWYFPISSLIENVEYSAQYHRPPVRRICAKPQAVDDTSLSGVVENDYLNSESDAAQLYETVDLVQSQPVVVVACR